MMGLSQSLTICDDTKVGKGTVAHETALRQAFVIVRQS